MAGFSALLLAWYDAHRRDLPWRAEPGETAEPYHVWLSEIMLQQTTVKAVIPYFLGFLEKWPTVETLATAPRDDVLKAWAGLGYYARARNLHACAETVARAHCGRFPETEAGLRALPGIGAYTAAAIAAIAFGERAVVVDGNIERVVARLFAIDTPLPQARADIREKVNGMTPQDRPGDFAQGMMDLGATVCTPRTPACAFCPFAGRCMAHRAGEETAYPVKAARTARPVRTGAAFFIRDGEGRVLLRRRPDKGLLGGMTEFPTGDWRESGTGEATGAPVEADFRRLDGTVRHVFTHFELHLTVHAATIADGAAPERCFWVEQADILNEALPSVMRKVAAHALKQGA